MKNEKIINVTEGTLGHLLIETDTKILVVSAIFEKETEKEEKKLEPKKKEEAPAKAKTKPVPEPEPEDDDEDESLSYDDLKEMDREDLEALIKENELETDPDDFDEDEEDDLRKAIAKECGIEIPKKVGGKEKPAAKKEKEVVVDEEDLQINWKDLQGMDYDELCDLVKEDKLKIDLDNYEEDDEDDLRKAVAKKMGITVK